MKTLENFSNSSNFKLFKVLLLIWGFGISSSAFALGQCDFAVPVGLNAVSPPFNHVASGQEFYKVATPSAGNLNVFFQSAVTSLRFYLYDKDCVRLGSLTSSIKQVNLPQSTYYIGVNGTVAGSYKLRVDGDFTSDDRGVSCPSAAVVRGLGQTGVMGPYSDSDFFQVTVGLGGRLTVSKLSNGSISLKLYNKECVAVTGSLSRIDTTVMPGIYYVNVNQLGDNGTGPYNLTFAGNVIFPAGSCAGKAATISGTTGSDVIRGTAGSDVIQGFGGNDVIFGLGGDDIICGGDGDDVIQGEDGVDRLLGEAGNDVLQGGDKNDALDGGLNSDICDGGALTDTAVNCEVKNLVP